MIGFRDFAPERKEARGFFGRATYAELSAVMPEVNQWVDAAGVDVLNIETVVLPNIWHPDEHGTQDPSLKTTNVVTTWHQFVRVWYREGV